MLFCSIISQYVTSALIGEINIMIKRILSLALVLLLIAGCGAKPAPAEKKTFEIEIGGDFTPNTINEVMVDGAFNFQRIEGASFTMDYEPRVDSYVLNHFGLDFGLPIDTNWLGDDATKASFDINEKGTDVYGSVVITTAPMDLKAYYETEDLREIAIKINEEFLTSEKQYEALKAEAADKNYEIVMEGCGLAFPEQDIWNACYVEYKNTDDNTRSMRLYLCNDEVNEKFYSMSISADLPEDDADRIEKYRSIIFSLHARGDGKVMEGQSITIG